MAKYISILRGINVSGQKKILMADLKALYETQGFGHVITYIQSGNVIFDSDAEAGEVKAEIEQAIKTQYGFEVPVDVRTEADYQAIIDNCPFGEVNVEQDGTKILVTFLSGVPNAEKLEQAQKFATQSETMILNGTTLYLHCPNGYGKTKLSNAFLEKKLGLSATTRNWKSVLKLRELAGE